MSESKSFAEGRRVLRPKGVAHKMSGGVSTVWYRAKTDPTFPKPFKLGPRQTVWWEHEVDAWLEQRAASRGGVQP